MALILSEQERYALTVEIEDIIIDEVYVVSYGCCGGDYEIEDRDLAARRIVALIEQKFGPQTDAG